MGLFWGWDELANNHVLVETAQDLELADEDEVGVPCQAR